jgi:hypothetical protein
MASKVTVDPEGGLPSVSNLPADQGAGFSKKITGRTPDGIPIEEKDRLPVPVSGPDANTSRDS